MNKPVMPNRPMIKKDEDKQGRERWYSSWGLWLYTQHRPTCDEVIADLQRLGWKEWDLRAD